MGHLSSTKKLENDEFGQGYQGAARPCQRHNTRLKWTGDKGARTVVHSLKKVGASLLRTVGALAAIALLTGILSACAPEQQVPPQVAHPNAVTPKPQPVPSVPQRPSDSSTTRAEFLSVIDGDTIETSEGTVRLIGIDTPERGECGHDVASTAIGKLLSRGDVIELMLPDGQHDEDRYNRLLRYVLAGDGTDLGLMQIEAGNAIARYDSRDGYPKHPNEARYREAQIATAGPDRKVITSSCVVDAVVPPAPAPTQPLPPEPAPSTADPAVDAWWTQYSSCTRLKKSSSGHPTGPFNRDNPAETEIYNWFAHGTGNRGDGDGDGLACE